MFLGELADRLQHRKPGPPRRPVGDEQRLAHQRIQQIQNGVVVGAIESGDRAGTLEVESTGEHRTPLQQRLLGVVEQVVGPRHRVAQRLVAFQPAPRADQQPEPVIETIPHLARPSSTPSARPPTRWPTGSRRGGGRSPPPRRPHQPWPARSAGPRCGRVRRTAPPPRSRCPHRTSSEGTGHNCSSATPNPSRLVANIRTVAECARIASTRSAAASRTCSQLSNTNNRTLPSNAAATLTRLTALARLLGDAQHRGHRVGHRRRIADRGQFEKPDAVRELVGQPRRDFGRQAGLADPAHPGQRHQPMSLHRLLHLGQFGFAPDEARRWRPQVSRCRIERLQGRKLRSAGRRPGPGTSRPGLAMSRNRRGPKVNQVDSAEQTRCRRRSSRIWPPCPAAITRAARFSTAPK